MKKKLPALALCASLGLLLGATSYHPPENWKGTEKGATANNPVIVDEKPMWQFEQVDPDKQITDASAYMPMKWTGSKWIGETEFGGQPSIAINRTTALLEVRGSWGGSGNSAGKKIAALRFMAPEAGEFEVAMKVSADVWQGGASPNIHVFKQAGEDAPLEELAVYKLDKGAEPIEIDPVVANLESGHSLVFVAVMNNRHNAAKVKLERLKITNKAEAAS